MGLGLFLIPTIGGYWFLTQFNYTRYRVFRDSGYHTLFSSAFVGALLFGVAHLIILLLNHCCPPLDALWESYFPAAYSDTVALSVALGVALPPIVNQLHRLPFRQGHLTQLPLVGIFFYDAAGAAYHTARENNDFIELLIADSIADQKLVELSLKSGKSYIGLGLVYCIGPSEQADVIIVPMASGYRDQETKSLTITTHYAAVIEQSLAGKSDLSEEDFRIVIPMSEIVSARLFFPEAYELFQETAPAAPAGPPEDS